MKNLKIRQLTVFEGHIPYDIRLDVLLLRFYNVARKQDIFGQSTGYCKLLSSKRDHYSVIAVPIYKN